MKIIDLYVPVPVPVPVTEHNTEGGDPVSPAAEPAGQGRGLTEFIGNTLVKEHTKLEQELIQNGSVLIGETPEDPPSPAAKYPVSPPFAPGNVDIPGLPDSSRAGWQNPLSSKEIGYLERRLTVKGWQYNAPNAIMRAALSLMIRMMGDRDPAIALYTAIKALKHNREIGFRLRGVKPGHNRKVPISKPKCLTEIDRIFAKLPDESGGANASE